MRKIFSFFVAFLLSATSFAAVSYELNGGVQSEWENPQAMYNELNTIWNTFSATEKVWGNLEELKANVVQGIPDQAREMDLTFLNDSTFKAKFEWLVTYMDAKCGEQGQPLPSTYHAYLRYNLQAFFIDGVRASWPPSANYTTCGVSTLDAYQPYWKSSYANPTNPTAEVTLWAPYKEGATFDGWYWNEDFSGDKVTTINAESNGTLYAKWGDYVPTIVEVHALADSTETKTVGVVNFISGRNVWIQDASAGILVYTAETPSCKVGDKITVKGKKVIYGGAPEITGAVIEATEAGELFAIAQYENLAALVADSLEHKYFATRVTVPGVIIVEYDSYNNPIVEDDLGNKAKCYKMVLDPTVYPVGTKVTVTAVAAWFNEFQFVGDAKNIVIPVAGVKENYTYPERANGRYALENNWVISNIEDNFAANKLGSNDYVRGMAAKDGIMYFINRETESLVRVDGETGKMLEPLKLQGEHLFEVQEEDGTWKSGVAYAFNDIKFDQAGNCLIGACMTGAATCQTFFIYIVDLATGVCTKLIEDYLWDNPGLNEVRFRFDAFGVAGDVTKNGVIMAADANGSWNVYRWLIEGGVAGEGEQVAVIIDPAVDQSLFVNAAGFGTAPQIFPQNEDGTLFYVDGNNTLPMLFYGNPDEGAKLVDDFINVPTGVKVWNNGGDTIAMNAILNFNGLVEFQVGEEYFLLMVATNNEHADVKSSYALYKFADADRMFKGMEPLWYFPHNGLGSQTNGCRTAPVSVEVVDDHTAKLYLYAVNNGYASYTFSLLPANITVTSNNTTMGTVSGSGVYDIGDNAVITAIPKGGYHFSHWDDGNTQNPRVVKVTEHKTYTAYFDKNTYSITKQYDAEQGSITGPTSGKYLDVITLTATPKYGYHFAQWSDGVTDNPRTFVITQDTTFTAEFAPNKYTITTVSSDTQRGTTQGDTTVNYLEYITISATASYGYHFVQWNDGNKVNPRQVQVTKDMTYTATFDKNIYNISLQSNNGTIESVTHAAYLDNVTMMANADYGYHFAQWSDGVTDNPRTFVITQDTTFTAEFAPNKYTITTVSSDTQRGTTQGDTTVNYLEYITISAAASYGYHFVQWNDGNSVNPRQVQVTEDKTYTAYFDKNTYYITKNYDSNQGYINGSSSGEYLDNITLTAEPNYGYHFTQWSDGNTENPRTLILTQDTTFTAEFASNQYTITTTSSQPDRGTTQGDTTVNYREYTTISADANYGYHFENWNDGNADNPRRVQVRRDETYTAYFEKDTYSVTTNYNSEQGYIVGVSSGEYLDNITLTAEANYGYHFVQWSDGNTENPRTLTLTQDTVLTAEFAQSYSGQCGDNLYWAYNESVQSIAITGTGDMYNYMSGTQPWVLFLEKIKKVTTDNTAASLGTSAFEGAIRLAEVHIGAKIDMIEANVFAGCDRLRNIYCYPTYPPIIRESSFARYDALLYIPCDYIEDYMFDYYWKKFENIQCAGAEKEEVESDEVEVDPSSTSVTMTWPTEENAYTYTIEIHKDGALFCRLVFNTTGQLLNISFAPSRDGNNRPAQHAELVANGSGLRFTVTGLNERTHYTYDLRAKDKDENTIQSHSGEFTTKSNVTTDMDNIQSPVTTCQKLLRDGQLIILRDGVEYNAVGQEM